MKKKIFGFVSMFLIMAMVMVGCAGNQPAEQSEEPAAEEASALKVALVVAGGLGDRSFYDSSNEGLKMAIEKLGVVS